MIEEYRDSVKKVKSSRKHRVSNSLGVIDSYLYFRKLNKEVSQTDYRKIIRTVNLLLREKLSNGEDVHLPNKMGYLELRKYQPKVEIKEGKVITNLPIDWSETIKLWYNNPKAAERKVKVRIETPYVYRVIYKKSAANFINKSFYQFFINRELKKALKNNINENKVDAFTFKRK